MTVWPSGHRNQVLSEKSDQLGSTFTPGMDSQKSYCRKSPQFITPLCNKAILVDPCFLEARKRGEKSFILLVIKYS